MKITCLIDSLNSGGAQRQIVNLAVLLKKKGHEVDLISYYPQNHFDLILKKYNLKHHQLSSKNKFHRIFKVKNKVKKIEPDILIAFLDIPSFIAILISSPYSKWKTVVSERVIEIKTASFLRRLNRFLYRWVDYVTTNSFSNKNLIIKNSVIRDNKLKVIYNSVDLKRFKPDKNGLKFKNKFISVASFRETKNALGLFKAISKLKTMRPDLNFTLDWFGHKNNKVLEKSSKVYDEAVKYIFDNNLEEIIRVYSPVKNIESKYIQYDALILPSFTEGLPNVVCEAMTCGLPILMSDVADAKLLVENEKNGYLFNPHVSDEICSALINFMTLDKNNKQKMGNLSRAKSELLFSEKKYVESYYDVFKKLIYDKK